jgi:hypothetical protein
MIDLGLYIENFSSMPTVNDARKIAISIREANDQNPDEPFDYKKFGQLHSVQANIVGLTSADVGNDGKNTVVVRAFPGAEPGMKWVPTAEQAQAIKQHQYFIAMHEVGHLLISRKLRNGIAGWTFPKEELFCEELAREIAIPRVAIADQIASIHEIAERFRTTIELARIAIGGEPMVKIFGTEYGDYQYTYQFRLNEY